MRRAPPTPLLSTSTTSNEGRLAARVAASVAREAQRRGHSSLRLRVHRQGLWFQVSREPPVSLEKHAILRRLLVELAQAHSAGRVISRHELVVRGWPDERVLEGPANNRIKVALSQLRRLGLADVLETAPGGYRLSSTCAVAFVEGMLPFAAD
jgi:DNA-binding response OmpR family regulator